jgi:hypothetical protein
MAIFNSKLLVYRRVKHVKPLFLHDETSILDG